MTPASEILAEIEAVGAVAYRRGDEVRMRPARAITPALLERVRRHKAELLVVLPPAPPDVAALPAVPVPTEPEPWIVSSGSAGAMRLVVEAPPEDWTPAVWRAAALVEILDVRTQADRGDAQDIADQLERALAGLRAEGLEAWLTS